MRFQKFWRFCNPLRIVESLWVDKAEEVAEMSFIGPEVRCFKNDFTDLQQRS